MCCRLKWISGQNDFKLVLFLSPLFYSHHHHTETKENTNQTSLKSFWPEILQQCFSNMFSTTEDFVSKKNHGGYSACIIEFNPDLFD